MPGKRPVTQLGDQSLTDAVDADLPVFTPAYTTVTLTDLDGSGGLSGRHVRVKSTTGKPAAAPYAYHRDSSTSTAATTPSSAPTRPTSPSARAASTTPR